MQQQDIKDIILILNDAMSTKDFDIVADAVEQLKEYLDDDIEK